MPVAGPPILRAHAALCVAACIYAGFNVVMAKCLGSGISPIAFSLVREAFSIVALYTWASLAEGPLRMPRPALRARFALLGCFLGGFQLCFAAGIALTDAQTAALFQCVEPTTAALLGALLRLERLTPTKALGAVLAGAGIVIMQLRPHDGADEDDDGILRASAATASTDAATPSGVQRAVGCALLFGQGVGIACYCLLQRTLLSVPAPPEARLLYAGSGDVAGEGSGEGGGDGVGEGGGDEGHGEGGARVGSDGNGSGAGHAAADADVSRPPSTAAPPDEETDNLPIMRRLYGPITVTAHAYVASLMVMLLAALVSTAGQLESPPPLSTAGLARLFSDRLALAGVAYAVLLGSCAGYSLRAWANQTVEASTLVLYNAVQPPLTALLNLLVEPERPYTWREATGTLLVMAAVVLSGSQRVNRVLACGRCVARTPARES